MSKVSKYSVLVYSGEQGYQNNRAQITLADSDAIVSPLSDSKIRGCPASSTRRLTGLSPCEIGRAFLFAKLRRAGQGTSNLAAAVVRTVAGAPWHECPSVSTRSMSCAVKDSGRLKRPGMETDSSQPETILGDHAAAAAMSRTHGPQLFP